MKTRTLGYYAKTLFFDGYVWVVQLLLSVLPVHVSTNYLRGFLMRPAFGSCKGKLQIGSHVIINHPKHLHFGRGCYLSHNCYVQAKGGISLEDSVIVGPMSILATGNHVIEQGAVTHKGMYQPIHIGKGSWLGGHCTVISGVSIGRNIVVGAGSVVTRDLTEPGLYAGTPAKLIRSRRQEWQKG